MALSFTERFRCGIGGRAYLFIDVTQDENTSTFTAASVGLTYIEEVQNLKWSVATSGAANQAAFDGYCDASILNGGTTIDLGTPMKTGSIKHALLIGW